MKSIAVIVFVGIGAIVVGMLPTVVDPHYVETVLKGALDEYHPSDVVCDRDVVIGVKPPKFGCKVLYSHGRETSLAMTMNTDGGFGWTKQK